MKTELSSSSMTPSERYRCGACDSLLEPLVKTCPVLFREIRTVECCGVTVAVDPYGATYRYRDRNVHG